MKNDFYISMLDKIKREVIALFEYDRNNGDWHCEKDVFINMLKHSYLSFKRERYKKDDLTDYFVYIFYIWNNDIIRIEYDTEKATISNDNKNDFDRLLELSYNERHIEIVEKELGTEPSEVAMKSIKTILENLGITDNARA